MSRPKLWTKTRVLSPIRFFVYRSNSTHCTVIAGMTQWSTVDLRPSSCNILQTPWVRSHVHISWLTPSPQFAPSLLHPKLWVHSKCGICPMGTPQAPWSPVCPKTVHAQSTITLNTEPDVAWTAGNDHIDDWWQQPTTSTSSGVVNNRPMAVVCLYHAPWRLAWRGQIF